MFNNKASKNLLYDRSYNKSIKIFEEYTTQETTLTSNESFSVKGRLATVGD